jgi:putative transferase (TIGR04331 family)
MLVRAGILFESPEEAAGEVSAHWDGVDEWWKREEVQEARLAFCEQYSRRVSNPTRKLKELLSATLKEF